MGVSASTNKQTIENNILNKAYNSCPSMGTTNIVNLSGIKFEPPPDCNPPSSMTIGQTATIDSNCLLTSLQSSAAEIAAELSAEAKAGLGISGSTNVNDIKQSISNITKNTCANVSTTNNATIRDTVIKSCQFRVVQNATENVSCQINTTQDLVSKIASSSASTAKGGSIWGDIFGSGPGGLIAGIVVIIIIIIVIAIIIYFVTKNKNKVNTSNLLSTQTLEEAALLGGFNNILKGGWNNIMDNINNPGNLFSKIRNSNTYKLLIISILVLIIVILYKTLHTHYIEEENTSANHNNQLNINQPNHSNTNHNINQNNQLPSQQYVPNYYQNKYNNINDYPNLY
ncbi:putative myristoylated membrane protein [Moumouvirus australiensis]|uniref:Putative myristoylated membrane protein n=1 Tax=Moumouvirus australiensis TaxID=2109587 RepID=A0A2P1ELX3_9VIRU|nr:putative myristoylated membrane protein [Moumouvirus australiensis]AVL94891.1 putative myristoylated membrane protein [Moumouvirus australiensis]